MGGVQYECIDCTCRSLYFCIKTEMCFASVLVCIIPGNKQENSKEKSKAGKNRSKVGNTGDQHFAFSVCDILNLKVLGKWEKYFLNSPKKILKNKWEKNIVLLFYELIIREN